MSSWKKVSGFLDGTDCFINYFILRWVMQVMGHETFNSSKMSSTEEVVEGFVLDYLSPFPRKGFRAGSFEFDLSPTWMFSK